MAELRGRPLAFVALALAAWVSGRVAWEGDWQPRPISATATSASAAVPSRNLTLTAFPDHSVPSRTKHAAAGQRARIIPSAKFRPPPALDPWQDGGRPSGLPSPALVAGGGGPLSTGRDTPPSNALAPVGKAGQPIRKPRWGGALYAYSFWRFASGGGAALAPGAQYGGSQSGLMATLDPFGEPERGLALLLRGSATPDWNEREVALGFRWAPDKDWPLTLSAERRFRMDAPDRFAAYLAGGFDRMRLAGQWKVDAYGQAGYVTGQSAGGFFDAQVRATHPLVELKGVPLSIGAGGWAGGQKGAARLDVGPTLQAQIDTRLAKFKLQLDWRQQLAGNAVPKNGVALTVSTGL